MEPVTAKKSFTKERAYRRARTPGASLGQGALYLVLLVGGTSVLVGVTLAFLVSSLAITTGGSQAANRALATASSGARDAMIQLIRNRSFSPGTYCSPEFSCPPVVPDGVAQVTVERDQPFAGYLRITSRGSFRGNQRKIEAVVTINPTTSEVTLVSWKQLTF